MKKILFAIFLLLNTSYVIFAQVSNDDCATAQVITIPSSGNICINSTTVAALGTTYTSHPCFPLNQNIPDVWFTFITTGASNTVTVSPTGTPAAKKLGVSLNTSGCASSVLNTCNLSATNGGTATATWTYPLGTQVWINVSSITLQGGFQLCITSVTAPPAPGNTCGTATTICNKNNFSLATFPANSNPYTPDCFPTALQRPVFYQFTVGKSGTCIWTATPTGTVEYDWVIYDITSGCPGTVVCCNFNYGDGTGSPIGMSTGGAGACGSQGFNGPTDEFSPAASVIVGKTYLLVIDNYSNNSVGFDFTWGGTMEIAPTSQFTATPTTACGSSNVTITNTSIAATDWDWNFGDGATLNNTQNPPIHAYASPGTYLISLVTTSSTGCQDVETKSVIVKPNPTVVISGGGNVCSDGVSSPATQNVVFTMTGTGPYNFTYAIAGVSQTPLTNQTSPYTITADHTKAGAYTLVTLTDNGTGCSTTTATGSATITSISCGCAQPTITPGTPVAVCKGSTSTTFTYSGITNSPDTYSIDWDATANGAGFVDVVNTTLSASPLSISLPAGAAAATYTGSLTVTNTGTSCTSIPQNISVTIKPNPTVVISGGGNVCSDGVSSPATQNVVFTMTGTGPYNFTYAIAGVSQTPLTNQTSPYTITADHTKAGAYTLVTLTDNGTGCSTTTATGSATITSISCGCAQPTITPGTPVAVCKGSTSTTFTYSGITNSPDTYSIDWDATANGAGFVDVVNTTLSASPLSISLPAGAAAATYTGSLTVTNTGTSCTSIPQNISLTINGQPTITPGTPVAVCKGSTSTTFTYSGITNSPDTYSIDWDATANGAGFADVVNTTLSASPLSISLPAGAVAATYTGSLTVTNTTTSCTSIPQNISVIINPLPSVTVNSPSICGGTNATLTATPTIAGTYSFAWTVQAPETNPGDMASFSVSTAGVYSVIITNTTTTCSSTSANGTVTIKPLPTSNITGGGAICPTASSSVNIALTGTAPWSVTYTDGTTPVTVPNILTSPYIINTSTIGVFSVTAVSDGNSCNATSFTGTATVTLKPLPSSTISGGGSVCMGTPAPAISIALIGTGPWNLTYSNGTTSTPATAATSPYSITNPGAGTYSVTALSDANCTGTSFGSSVSVVVKPIPTAIITGGGTSCIGDPINPISIALTGLAPWTINYTNGTTPNTITSGISPYVISNPTAGTYSGVSVSDANNCSAVPTGNATVTINPKPTVIVNSQSICIGESATLYATPSTAGGNYLWTPSGSNNDSLIVFPAIPTTYTVSYTLNSCSNSASGTILVSPLPEASFSAPLSTSIFNPVVNFTDNSLGAISWNWNFGDMYSTNNTSFLQNPKHTYSKVGTYCVKLDIENIGGCTDSYTMCVIIDPEFTFYVPNAFTPNNDGTNDEFFGQGWEEFISGFEMYIFDRWGNSIFHTEDITKHWDGKVNGTGEVAQEDEYVYVINVKDSKGEKHKYIGGVTLVK